jgi:hypothetical protein
MLIGKGIGPNDFYNGIIDEVGIWSKALTQTEVNTLYYQLSSSNPCYSLDGQGGCGMHTGIQNGC